MKVRKIRVLNLKDAKRYVNGLFLKQMNNNEEPIYLETRQSEPSLLLYTPQKVAQNLGDSSTSERYWDDSISNTNENKITEQTNSNYPYDYPSSQQSEEDESYSIPSETDEEFKNSSISSLHTIIHNSTTKSMDLKSIHSTSSSASKKKIISKENNNCKSQAQAQPR